MNIFNKIITREDISKTFEFFRESVISQDDLEEILKEFSGFESSSHFIRLEDGNNRLRFVGKPYESYCYWDLLNKKRYYLSEEKALEINKKYGDKRAKRRYLCNCFDLENVKKIFYVPILKILDGIGVFQSISSVCLGKRIIPGDNDAPIFNIQRQGKGRDTIFKTIPDKKISPFSEDEKRVIKYFEEHPLVESNILGTNLKPWIKREEEKGDLWATSILKI